MRYTSFDQLNNKTLVYGDKLTIGKAKYVVRRSCLRRDSGSGNDLQVFNELNIDPALASRAAYGYTFARQIGGSPLTYDGDNEALTRLALMLFAFNEGSPYVELKMEDGAEIHFTRAELKR